MLAHAALRFAFVAEQTMGMPALPLDHASRRWTPEDVDPLNSETPSWPRYECIDGELLVTPPPPSWDHQEYAGRLFRAIAGYLDVQRAGQVLFAPVDVQLTEDSLIQPDLVVMPLRGGARLRGHGRVRELLLAVEVLSPGSVRADRIVKRRLHQRAGTPEYWIVDAEARAIERWRPEDTRPEIVTDVLTWHPDGATEPLRLDIERLLAD